MIMLGAKEVWGLCPQRDVRGRAGPELRVWGEAPRSWSRPINAFCVMVKTFSLILKCKN